MVLTILFRVFTNRTVISPRCIKMEWGRITSINITKLYIADIQPQGGVICLHLQYPMIKVLSFDIHSSCFFQLPF